MNKYKVGQTIKIKCDDEIYSIIKIYPIEKYGNYYELKCNYTNKLFIVEEKLIEKVI